MQDIKGIPVLFIFIYSALSCLRVVSGYYCNHDLCRDDQYCCGDNLCCDYVYSLWYFWVGIIFLVIILSVCGGFFRYCYDGNSYVVLQTCKTDYYPSVIIEREEQNLNCVSEDMDDPPPPYPESQYPSNYEKSFESYSSSGANGRSTFQPQHNPDVLVSFN